MAQREVLSRVLLQLPLCLELVDDWVLASEEQIADAMRLYMVYDNQLIEGAAGVAIARPSEYGGHAA